MESISKTFFAAGDSLEHIPGRAFGIAARNGWLGSFPEMVRAADSAGLKEAALGSACKAVAREIEGAKGDESREGMLRTLLERLEKEHEAAQDEETRRINGMVLDSIARLHGAASALHQRNA
jgi:hypothetical protein